jgi:hypothetical protein
LEEGRKIWLRQRDPDFTNGVLKRNRVCRNNFHLVIVEKNISESLDDYHDLSSSLRPELKRQLKGRTKEVTGLPGPARPSRTRSAFATDSRNGFTDEREAAI